MEMRGPSVLTIDQISPGNKLWRFQPGLQIFVSLLCTLLGTFVRAQSDFTAPNPLHKDDVRYYDLDRITNQPTRSQSYVSWFDAATPAKFQFNTANFMSRPMNTVELEKITFSLYQKIGTVHYFVTISDTKMLRIYTPILKSDPVYELMIQPATETSTVCPSATGIQSGTNVMFFVLCIKSINPPPTPAVPDIYYVEAITIPPTGSATRASAQFGPTATNTITIQRGVIRAATITNGGPRAVAFVFNSINMTEVSTSLADQPNTKYMYTVDFGQSPAKSILVNLNTIQNTATPPVAWQTQNFKFIFDMEVLTINTTPPEQRLMVLGYNTAYAVTGFRITIASGDVAIGTWDIRATTGISTQSVYVQFSLNPTVIYGFDIDGKRSLIIDYNVGTGATDTMTSPVYLASYQGRAAAAGLGECDQLDANNRFCTIIYQEVMDNTNTTVFEMIHAVRSVTPAVARVDRIFLSGRANGFYYAPSATEISLLAMNRMEVATYPILGGDTSRHKKNYLVLNATRFPARAIQDLTIRSLVSTADATTTPVDRKIKWIGNEMLWELAAPANLNTKITWYQNTALPVIIPPNSIKGTGVQYTFSGAGLTGGVIKDNPVTFTSFGTGDALNIADNELYLLGNLAVVKTKALTGNFWVYQCMNMTNATTLSIMMNCTQRIKLTTFSGSVVHYNAFVTNQIVVVSMIGATGFSITVVSNSSWMTGTIQELTIPMASAWTYYNPTSRKVFAAVVIQVNLKWIIRVYDLSDNGVGKLVVYETDPAVSPLNNPAGIARMQSESAITVVDIRGTNSLYYLVTSKLSATVASKIDFNAPMAFYRDTLLKTSNPAKANFCLFDNNRLLFYYTDASRVAGLSLALDNDYDTLSLGLADFMVTRILRVDCDFRSGRNSFAVIGVNNPGSIAIVYDVDNFEMLDRRVKGVSTLDATNTVEAGYSYYDGSAWFFAGYRGTTPYVRVLNDSAPVIMIRSADLGSKVATITITNRNASITTPPSFTVTANFIAPTTSLSSTPLLPTTTPIDPNTTLLLDNFVRYDGPILSAKLIAPNATLTIDAAQVTFNRRIIFARVVYQLSRLRLLASEQYTNLPSRRILQADAFYPTNMRVRDGLMIATTDLPTRTRFLVFQNTDVFKRDVDMNPLRLCSSLDFRVAADGTVSMVVYCADNRLRFLRFATDALSPLMMEWTSDPINVPFPGGTAISLGSIMAFCDNTYDRWFIVARDMTNNAIRVYGGRITSTAAAGTFGLSEKFALLGSSIFAGVDLVVGGKWHFCTVMVEGATNTLKGMCVDPSVEPLTVTLPALTDIPFAGASTGTILNVSCARNPRAAEDTFFCDVLTFDAKIYEIGLKVVPGTPIKIEKNGTENQYDRYRDAYGTNIASGAEYFVVTGASIEESFEKFIVYKRMGAGGSRWPYFAVDGPECTGQTGSITRTSMAIFNHPVDSNPRLMITDLFNKTLARVYRITNWNLTFNNVGFYEMDRVMNLMLNLNNESIVMNTTVPMRSIFFSPNTPNKTVNDLVTKDWFWDYLVWWCIGGGILLIIGTLFGLYVCRRETLKKYANSGGNQ